LKGSELLLAVNPLKPAKALAVGAMTGGGGLVVFNCTLANGLVVTGIEVGFSCTLANRFFADAEPSALLVMVLKAIGAIADDCIVETGGLDKSTIDDVNHGRDHVFIMQPVDLYDLPSSQHSGGSALEPFMRITVLLVLFIQCFNLFL